VRDNSNNGCQIETSEATNVHSVTGQINIRTIASHFNGCDGMVELSQVAIREPAGLMVTTMMAIAEQLAAEENLDTESDTSSSDDEVVEEEVAINVDYDKHRRKAVDPSAIQSVFALNQFADSEMLFTLDTPSIQSAQALDKFVHFRYAVTSPTFNQGPLPCTTSSGFEFSVDSEAFSDASISHCTENYLYTKDDSGDYLSNFYLGKGGYWGKAIGGNNSWNHSVWIYVR